MSNSKDTAKDIAKQENSNKLKPSKQRSYVYNLSKAEKEANMDPSCPIYFFKSSYKCAKLCNLFEYNTPRQIENNKIIREPIEFFDPELLHNPIDEYYEKYRLAESNAIPIVLPEYTPPSPYTKEIYSNPDNLYKATYAAQKGVTFKGSIQHMQLNRLKKVNSISKDMRSGKFTFDEPMQFTLNERGHERSIKAQSVKDRIALHSYNDNIFVPKTLPYLIYDNGASVKNKGVSFTRKRFKEHLIWAHQHFDGHFYILFIDFSKFFDNLEHSKIIEYFSKFLDQEELRFLSQCLKTFEIDVSYMEDNEIEQLENTVFNSLDYDRQRRETYKELGSKEKLRKIYNKSKTMKKSVDIGNHLSQMIGIYYPHEIDNYCKTVLGIHCYDRYMDDTAIMAKTKEELQDIANKIEQICERIGLHMNRKKTRIIDPYKGPATFLKINYFITDTGKIIEKVHSETFRRQRRRIPKLINLVEKDILTPEDFLNCYKSWRGSYYIFDSKLEILKMDDFVYAHFTPKIHDWLIKEYDGLILDNKKIISKTKSEIKNLQKAIHNNKDER